MGRTAAYAGRPAPALAALALVSALALAFLTAGCSAGDDPARPAPSSAASARPTPTWAAPSPSAPSPSAPSPTVGEDQEVVLALGDSLAAGLQPGRGDDRAPSYPARFTELLRSRGVAATTVNLGCSGETTASMISGGLCRYAAGAQLDQAVREVERHGDRLAAITLDIGANDVLRCGRGSLADTACTTGAIAEASGRVDTILGRLRSAAGQRTPIAIVLYYNPFRVVTALSAEDHAAVEASWTRLNAELAARAGAHGVTVVDLSAAFGPDGATGSAAPGTGDPLCTLTWMCTKGDIHLTDAGAEAIARAIAEALPATP